MTHPFQNFLAKWDESCLGRNHHAGRFVFEFQMDFHWLSSCNGMPGIPVDLHDLHAIYSALFCGISDKCPKFPAGHLHFNWLSCRGKERQKNAEFHLDLLKSPYTNPRRGVSLFVWHPGDVQNLLWIFRVTPPASTGHPAYTMSACKSPPNTQTLPGLQLLIFRLQGFLEFL